jgi:hypothetical protein
LKGLSGEQIYANVLNNIEGSMSFREYYKNWVVGFGRRGTRSKVNIVSENLFHHFRKYRWYRMILED